MVIVMKMKVLIALAILCLVIFAVCFIGAALVSALDIVGVQITYADGTGYWLEF